MRKTVNKRRFLVFGAIIAIAFLVAFFLYSICQAPIMGESLKYLGASLIDAPVFDELEEARPPEPAVASKTPAPSNDGGVSKPGEVGSLLLQDQLDDIAEQLDIIQQQVNELITEQQEIPEDEKEEEDTEDQEKDSKKTYPKILISEVKVNPISERFVKLYNPNNQDVDLTGWYMQRKTATSDLWSSFVSSTYFEGKTIRANGYFLISRELAGSDILLNITLSDKNSLALKNPNREIVDEVMCYEEPDPPPSADGGGSNDVFSPTGSNDVFLPEESCFGKININTAILEQLDELAGIGPAYAQRIIDARPFLSIDDLLQVSGIGEKTLQKIKDQGCAFVEATPGN